MHVEARLQALGPVLPHPPQNPDGTLAGPFGKVGAAVSVEAAQGAARLAGLAILGSLQRALGDLDRVTAWLRVCGMINAAPGFTQPAHVLNAFSDLILDLYGEEAGQHARTAVGVAALSWNNPLVIEAEVEIAPE